MPVESESHSQAMKIDTSLSQIASQPSQLEPLHDVSLSQEMASQPPLPVQVWMRTARLATRTLSCATRPPRRSTAPLRSLLAALL